MQLITKKNRIIVFLLILSFIVPFIGLLILSGCQEGTINKCISSHSNIFSDFILFYNIVKYIAHHNGDFPTIVSIEEGCADGITCEGYKSLIYHPPLYFYLIAPLYVIANKLNISDLFVMFLFSNLILLLGSMIFFLVLKNLSGHLFLNYDQRFMLYSLVIFLFLPIHMYMGTVILTDIMLYFFATLAVFFYFKLLNTKGIRHSVILGFILGLSLLSRIASVSIIGGFILQMFVLHLKKEKKIRNLLFYSIIIGLCLGSFAFIKNLVAYGDPLGDATKNYLNTPKYAMPHELHFSTLVRAFSSYWGGFFGGYDPIKPIIVVLVIILCAVTIFGFIYYFRKYDVWLSIFSMIALSTLIVLIPLTINLSSLITRGMWIGQAPGGRYFSLFNYFIAVFAGLGLVKLKQFIKNTKLRFLPELFIIFLALLFIIDYIYALI